MTDFNDIYSSGYWGAGSGGGSDPVNAAAYVKFLNGFIAEMEPGRVLDIGCGDGRLAAAVDWRGARYYGIDVAPGALELSLGKQDDITASAITFARMDALTDVLPPADLVICKEVTQHIDNEAVSRLIERLREYPAVLHCSAMVEPINELAPRPGRSRGVVLSLPPFSLPTETVCRYEIGKTEYICELWKP